MKRFLKVAFVVLAFVLALWGVSRMFTACKHVGHKGHCCEEGH